MNKGLNQKWFLLQIKPNAYQIAIKNLNQQGFYSFTPMIQITERRLDKFKNRLTLLFPGYMFIKLDTSSNLWKQVNNTYGVSKLVVFGKRPNPLPPGLVENLISRCDKNNILKNKIKIKAGDSVNVLTGPLSEFVAKVDKIEKNKRVWMLLDFLGRQTLTSIGIEKISKTTTN